MVGIQKNLSNKMDKLDRFAKKFADNVNITQRSRYYQFGNWVIRISDHLSQSSDFTISIITLTIHSLGMYVIHNKETNTVSIVEYEDLKTLVKSFRILAGNKLTPAKLRSTVQIAHSEQIEKLKHRIVEQRRVINDLQTKLQNRKPSTHGKVACK